MCTPASGGSGIGAVGGPTLEMAGIGAVGGPGSTTGGMGAVGGPTSLVTGIGMASGRAGAAAAGATGMGAVRCHDSTPRVASVPGTSA